MSVDADLEICFDSPIAGQLPSYTCISKGIAVHGDSISLRIQSAEQVREALDLLIDAGVAPTRLSIHTLTNDAFSIDERCIIGVVPAPEDAVDIDRVAAEKMGCRAFVQDSELVPLACEPRQTLRFGSGVAHRNIVNEELASYFRSTSSAEPRPVTINGRETDSWQSLDFRRTHEIFYVPAVTTTNQCRWCGTTRTHQPKCWIGRDIEWSDPLYCESTGWGHYSAERPLFVPLAHVGEFNDWTGNTAHLYPVFSDTTGPGKIALDIVAAFPA